MKKTFITITKTLVVFYLVLCGLLFFFQEKLIFFPQKLEKNYHFNFNQNFSEINIKSFDGISLHGLLFKADSSKGLVFYLHGNAGSLMNWGRVAKTYTDLNYDVFILDYRGFGKSEGSINSQEQIIKDVQFAYKEILKLYDETEIIVFGYSLGTGPAAKIASRNKPKLLILQAPYYSMTDLMSNLYPIIPTFLLKYKFETYKYIKDCEMPVVIFHGNLDEVVYYGSSLKLKEHFKVQDTLITLAGQKHNGMTNNPEYKIELQKVLNRF